MSAEHLPQVVATLHQVASYASLALQSATSDERLRNGLIGMAVGAGKELVVDFVPALRRGDEAAERSNAIEIFTNGFAGYVAGYFGTEIARDWKATQDIMSFLVNLNPDKVAHDVSGIGAGAYVIWSTDVVKNFISSIFNRPIQAIRGQGEQIAQHNQRQDLIYKIGIAYLGTHEPRRGDRDRLRRELLGMGIIDSRETHEGKIQVRNTKGKWVNLE